MPNIKKQIQKKFILRCSCLIFVGCLIGLRCRSKPVEKPNILFLFADDLSFRAINALGNQEVYTPNIDRLFSSGTSFTHTYNMGGWNGAICVASRAMLMSGRSIWRAQEHTKSWKQGKAFDQSWAELMKSAGYHTYMTGKWHIDAPADSLFQVARHVRPGMPPDRWNERTDSTFPAGYNRPLSPGDQSWSPKDSSFGGYWQGGRHWSEVARTDAIEFIQSSQNSEDPFFMYIAFNAPHDPRQAPAEYFDRYPIEEISVPENWLPEYPDKEKIGIGADLRDEALAPFPRTPYSIRKHIQEYYAIITHLDDQIGKILDALESSGEGENTYIIFTADHGLAIGKHGLLGKQNMYEHSMRVPFVIVGPTIEADKSIHTPIYLQSVMPTSLELAKIAKPDYVEFESLLHLLNNEEKAMSSNRPIYGAYTNQMRMLSKNQFKLILYPDIRKILLFNLIDDPEETNNLANDLRYQSIVQELFSELKDIQKEMGDGLDLESNYPKLSSPTL